MKETISILEGVWKFDNKVAKIFDKHVNQSIPHSIIIEKNFLKILFLRFLQNLVN